MPLSVIAIMHSPNGLGWKTVSNVESLAVSFNFTGRHCFVGDEEIVKTSRLDKQEAYVTSKNIFRFCEKIFGVFLREKMQEPSADLFPPTV